MKLRMTRAACALLAVVSLGAGLAGCVPLVIGGAALGSIRKWVAFNLALGLVIIAAMRFPLG